jgi:hypothetical protein
MVKTREYKMEKIRMKKSIQEVNVEVLKINTIVNIIVKSK